MTNYLRVKNIIPRFVPTKTNVMNQSAKNLLNSYSFSGNGRYYTTEQGSRAYRNTYFGAFAKNNTDLFTVIETGNDAPRGGKTGDYMVVEFSPEFLKAWQDIKDAKANDVRADEERKANENAQVLTFASLIETVEGEDYAVTAGRLGVAIGKKVKTSVFHRAVKLIRKR